MNVEIGNKYQILQEIKRGGFGIIYKGIDRRLGKPVAIKAIDPQFLGEARYIDMFQSEAMSVAQLNHHNIVQVYDIKRDAANQMYIIMEYIDGPDLMTLLQACRRNNIAFPAHLAAYIMAEVCNGLDYAHNRRDSVRGEPMNMVHQDLSPVNIMTSRLGEVKIIDFGMANVRRNRSKVGNQVFVQGNIHYMAPEQVNGAATVDRRCDIFSAGQILFELLMGERLIPSNNAREVLESLVTGNWDVIRFSSGKIPEPLREPIRRALEHLPKNRYPNANSFQKDLMHYLMLTAPAADFMSELSQFIQRLETANDLAAEPISYLETSTDVHLSDAASSKSYSDNDAGSSNRINPVQAPFQTESGLEEDAGASNRNSVQTVALAPTADLNSSRYYSIIAEADDEGQRTIIDVVRLSARTHKKAITLSALALLLGSLLFLTVDTFAHFTKMGTGIYDFLFPPAIKIVSVPGGAQVYLDDELLSETTPLSLDKISPGVHKLMLTLPQFEPIVKSINVPRSGGIRIAGETQRHASQPYIFRFKNQFEFASEPAGADILIDGVKTNHRTPATIFWEVSEQPIDIELELPGMPRLTGLRINTAEGKEYIADRRFWSLDRVVPGKAQFNIKGTFYKSIKVQSQPERADIHVDGSPRPVGVTGLNDDLLLKMGRHQITLKKNGYLPRTFDLMVNESSPKMIYQELPRSVKIFSRNASANDDRDLNAELVELSVNGRSQAYRLTTPAQVELLPKTYTVKLRKDGFHETFIEIPPTETTVVAKMYPLVSEIIVQALDAITSDPIKEAKISYSEDRNGSDTLLGRTDANGRVTARLAPGFYNITIVKDGYQEQVKTLRVRSDQENRLTFRLTLAR